MGGGPAELWRCGIGAAFATSACETITAPAGAAGEVDTTFRLYESLAGRVQAARRNGDLPVIISGNCGACISALAGEAGISLIWYDAHGDFNTPATSLSGFVDGMGLAFITGACFRSETSRIAGFSPFDPERVVHVGGRDFDKGELEAMTSAGVRVVPPSVDVVRDFTAGLAQLPKAVTTAHVHVDLDALDASEGIANSYATSGGLSLAQLIETLRILQRSHAITSLSLAAYDPSADPGKKIPAAARAILEAAVSAS
jgi:arginase